MTLLRVENLNLRYGSNQVLHNISFQVEEGEILCIVGESGSGKSSILYSIMDLLPPNAKLEGSIEFMGKDITTMDEPQKRALRGRYIGMVFQEPSSYLDPLFTVGSQIEETFLGHFPSRRAEAKEAVLSAMRRAGISSAEDKVGMYPHQLSGGLKQRVCIASAIVCEPKLLLADEPTTALDVSVQKKILGLFRHLRREGKSILLVTHDFGVVAEIGDRVVVLKDGAIVEEGSVFEIFDSPKDDYTKLLLSAI